MQVLDAPTGSNAEECRLLQLEKPLGHITEYPHLSNGHLLLDFQPVSEVDDFVEVKGKRKRYHIISIHINEHKLEYIFFPNCCLLLYIYISISILVSAILFTKRLDHLTYNIPNNNNNNHNGTVQTAISPNYVVVETSAGNEKIALDDIGVVIRIWNKSKEEVIQENTYSLKNHQNNNNNNNTNNTNNNNSSNNENTFNILTNAGT